jgi:hypothetical protein
VNARTSVDINCQNINAMLSRYYSEGVVDPIAVTAGLVQTALYVDFFYVYFTKYVFVVFWLPWAVLTYGCVLACIYLTLGYSKARSSNSLHKIVVYSYHNLIGLRAYCIFTFSFYILLSAVVKRIC